MTTKNYDIIRSVDELKALFDKIVEDGVAFGFDIETGYHGPDEDRGSLKMETNLLVGFSFTNSLDWARYVPMAHDFDANITDHFSVAEILWSAFKTGLMVAHNLGFELRRMARFFREMLSDHPLYGEQVRDSKGYFPALSDTQVEAYIRRDTFLIPHPKEDKMIEYRDFALKELVQGAFNHIMIKFEQLFSNLTEKKKKVFRFNVLDLSTQVITYACEDALWCLALHQRNYPVVKNQLVYKVDMDLVYVICDMEDCGIQYDWQFMAENSVRAKEFTAALNDEIQEELTEMLGLGEARVNVNLASPPQLSDILFNKLGMKVNVYTKTASADGDKKMSTGKEALALLAEKYPIAKKIDTWKKMTRLTGSFLDKYAKDYGNSPDGRIHSSLNQSYVRTARFSSSNPNQQNQPSTNIEIKDVNGKVRKVSYNNKLKDGTEFIMNFRDAIIAPEGFYILGFDLSQAEYRAVAGEANESALIEAFETGLDVHKFVASMMFKIPIENVTKLDRSKAKTIGFGLLYGMTSKALAKRLNVSEEESAELFDQYFAAFPRIKRWTEKQVDFGYENGFVKTRFGRKIPVWELKDSRKWIREGGERGCFNYPIQGGATGDYLRIAMVRAHKAIQNRGWQDKVKLFMNVHDALEFYVHKSMNPADVLNVLQSAVIFPVPGWPMLKADWHIGKRWGSVVELELMEDGSIKAESGKVFTPTEKMKPMAVVSEPPPPGILSLPTLDTAVESKPLEKPVIVELKHMPTQPQYDKFLRLLAKLGGLNEVHLKTPEGTVTLDAKTSLDPDNPRHTGLVSVAFDGASVYYERPEIDMASLVADIAL